MLTSKLAASILILGFVSAVGTAAAAGPDLDAEAWRADLRFLQHTVHADYPFLFEKTTAEAFDAEVERLHDAIPDLAPHEIVAGLTRLVSSFQYGHTNVGFWHSPHVRRAAPVNLYHFSDGVYVEGARREEEAAVGARVLRVEGVPIDEALATIRPLVPAENDQFFRAHGLRYLVRPALLHAQGLTPERKESVTFTLERDGRIFDRTIAAVEGRVVPARNGFTASSDDWVSARGSGPAPLYLRHPDERSYVEPLPDHKAVYVWQNAIQDDPDEPIPAFYARLFEYIEANDVERLVLDLRLNGGGNNYKNKPIVTGIVRCEKIDQPGRLFVIIGRRTFSACQNLVNELDNYTNAIFVGEPTAENVNFYGDNREITLPNCGLPVYLSFAWWQDKPPWENGPWTAPHVAVDLSFDDYRANRDPVLEAALAFTGDDFIRDPTAHFTRMFQAGRLDELAADAERLVRDPRYRFYDFEAEANRVGYELLEAQQHDNALWLFRLNTRLFPDSANTWDSLAETHWKTGRPEEAVRLYEKAIDLDPDGPVGENARRMLRQIQHERAAGG